VDRCPFLGDQRAAPHRRALGHPRDGGSRAGVLGRDLRPARLAHPAATGGISDDLAAAVDGRGRFAQDSDQRRLPLGPRAIRRPFPVRRAVRRPARCAARRALLSCSARQLRICAARPILRFSRAPCAARETWIGRGVAHRTDVRLGATGARRALRLARPVERVPRLDDHAVGLCARVPCTVVGIGEP
jgi:hypothetical protein